MDNETPRFGQFGFHPDPAMDFLCEVMEIQAEYNDFVRLKVKDHSAIAIFSSRIYKALEFKSGGVPSCVTAKHNLRTIRIAVDFMAADASLPSDPVPFEPFAIKADASTSKTIAGILKNREAYANATVGVDWAMPGSDFTAETRWVSIEFHRNRERELLEANTRAVERARAAEEKLREIEKATSSVAPALLKLIDQQITKRLQAGFIQKR